MYTINELTIDSDYLVANVTLTVGKGEFLVVNVPVKFPKTKEEVIEAIKAREKAEIIKADAAPVLTAIKAELDASTVGKEQV
jgi:hypothetical protein